MKKILLFLLFLILTLLLLLLTSCNNNSVQGSGAPSESYPPGNDDSRSESESLSAESNEGIDFNDPFDPVFSIDNKLINFVGTEAFEEWVKSKGDATITVIDFMIEFEISADKLSEIMGTSNFYDIEAIGAELLKRSDSEFWYNNVAPFYKILQKNINTGRGRRPSLSFHGVIGM